VGGYLLTHLEARLSQATEPVPFEKFMEAALYDPRHGYYMRAKEKFGWRGDFTTAPVLDASLGKAIARWVRRETKERRGPVTIIETGAGNGQLANQILKSLGWWGRRRIHYHIVEISPWLTQQQQSTRFARQIIWHQDLASALAASESPVIISNEFVDAFPCRFLQFQGGRWHEVGLRFMGDSRIREELLPLEGVPESSALETYGDAWPREGQRVEIHESYRRWFEGYFTSAMPCTLLTIDYGGRFPDLYHRRPLGTLRAFFQQMRLEQEEIYQRAGQQDITADVNFTDLERLGRRHGFQTEIQSMREFVAQVDPGALAARTDLFQAEGAGGAFQVLTLRRK